MYWVACGPANSNVIFPTSEKRRRPADKPRDDECFLLRAFREDSGADTISPMRKMAELFFCLACPVTAQHLSRFIQLQE